MRKRMIIPAMALSLLTFGVLAGGTAAGAHQVHRGEDNGDTTVTVPSGGGGVGAVDLPSRWQELQFPLPRNRS